MRALRAAGLAAAAVALMAAGAAMPASADDGPPPRPPDELPPLPDRASYVVQADLVICEDETGEADWTGSDELRFEFVSNDGAGKQVLASQGFGDVDTGETRLFGQEEPHVLLDLTEPTGAAPAISLNVKLLELDDWPTGDDVLGTANLKWSAVELHTLAPTVGASSTVQVPTFTGDTSSYVTQLRITRVL